MPRNNPDQGATLEITIQSQTFTVPHRYIAGPCELTAGEAHALQQVYAENLRNNFAAQMKKAAEGENPKQLTQADLDAYVASYEFGVRTGGVARDPIESAERSLAIVALKAALTKAGKSWKALSEEQQEALVEKAVGSGKFREQAEQVVAARKAQRAAAEAISLDLG